MSCVLSVQKLSLLSVRSAVDQSTAAHGKKLLSKIKAGEKKAFLFFINTLVIGEGRTWSRRFPGVCGVWSEKHATSFMWPPRQRWSPEYSYCLTNVLERLCTRMEEFSANDTCHCPILVHTNCVRNMLEGLLVCTCYCMYNMYNTADVISPKPKPNGRCILILFNSSFKLIRTKPK